MRTKGVRRLAHVDTSSSFFFGEGGKERYIQRKTVATLTSLNTLKSRAQTLSLPLAALPPCPSCARHQSSVARVAISTHLATCVPTDTASCLQCAPRFAFHRGKTAASSWYGGSQSLQGLEHGRMRVSGLGKPLYRIQTGARRCHTTQERFTSAITNMRSLGSSQLDGRSQRFKRGGWAAQQNVLE